MAKVRIKEGKSIRCNGRPYKGGDEIEMARAMAAAHVRAGVAEYVAETAVAETSTRARPDASGQPTG